MNYLSLVFLISMIYPTGYSFVQMLYVGPLNYFTDWRNFSHILYNVVGSLTAYCHLKYSPYSLSNKILLISTIFLSISKTL